jgi:hypothetical protein
MVRERLSRIIEIGEGFVQWRWRGKYQKYKVFEPSICHQSSQNYSFSSHFNPFPTTVRGISLLSGIIANHNRKGTRNDLNSINHDDVKTRVMKMKSKKKAKCEEKEFEASSSTVEFINFDDSLVFLLLAQFLRVVRFPTVDNFLLVVYILLCLFGGCFYYTSKAMSKKEGSTNESDGAENKKKLPASYPDLVIGRNTYNGE